MKKVNLHLCLAACLMAAVAPPAHAQYSLHRSTNAFFAALASSNYATESFSSLAPGFTNNPYSFTNSPYVFQANIPGSSFISVESYDGKAALATVATAQSLIFTNFSPTIRAFGAYLYSTDTNAIEAQPLTISLLLNSGPAYTFTTNVGTTSLNDYFFGFITDSPLTIQSLTLSVTNELAFATASEVTISTVPEPSTYAMLGLAAAALGAHIIRRRRS